MWRLLLLLAACAAPAAALPFGFGRRKGEQTNVVPAVDTTPQTNPVVDTAGFSVMSFVKNSRSRTDPPEHLRNTS